VFLGIYHHPVPEGPMQDFVHSHEVKDTWTNEAIAFASSYAAKSALWLLKLPK
jgi:hypothetical protein